MTIDNELEEAAYEMETSLFDEDSHPDLLREAANHIRTQEARIAALTKDAEPEPIGYMQKVIEALYENGDPVSIDAAELLERVSTVTTQWQPIDTAPKENGARVLLFGYAATYGGSADLKQPIIRCGRRENNTFSRMVQVEGTDLFRLEDYESDRWINDESYLTDDRLLDPTHWMPLPKPPIAAAVNAFNGVKP